MAEAEDFISWGKRILGIEQKAKPEVKSPYEIEREEQVNWEKANPKPAQNSIGVPPSIGGGPK